MLGKNWERFLATAMVITFTTGCGEDETPMNLEDEPPLPTIDNIWPHEDQRSWTYELFQRMDVGPLGSDCFPPEGFEYASPDSVPDAPSLDEVAALLGTQPFPEDAQELHGAWRLKFDGQRTTDSGASGQNLTETLFEAVSKPSGIAPPPASSRFLARLAVARPDLREAIAELAPSVLSPMHEFAIDPPFFLFGYAWEQTATHIGTYGDLDQLLAWKFLEGDLSVGHEFTHRLVPSLADDIFLHARVLSMETGATAIGSYPNALEVLYMVDFGVSEIVDPDGITVGALRAISYGSVTYAPLVGPIASRERALVFVGAGGKLSDGCVDNELDLIGTGLPESD